MGGSRVNFHNFSIDPVKVKFDECYSYTIRMLGKMGNLLLDTFLIRFPNYARNRHVIYYFRYSKFYLPNGLEIFMVAYVQHEIATVIFVEFYE